MPSNVVDKLIADFKARLMACLPVLPAGTYPDIDFRPNSNYAPSDVPIEIILPYPATGEKYSFGDLVTGLKEVYKAFAWACHRLNTAKTYGIKPSIHQIPAFTLTLSSILVNLLEREPPFPPGHAQKQEDPLKTTTNYFFDLLSFPNLKTVRADETYLCRSSNEALVKILLAVNKNASITTLDLRSNLIKFTGALIIADWLENNNQIRKLDLAQNNIKLCGGARILQALKKNHTLDSLIISNLDLPETEESAAFFGYLHDSLQENRGLSTLDISFNEFNDAAVSLFAQSILIGKKSPIKALRLIGHRMSAIGAGALGELLNAPNMAVEYLDLAVPSYPRLGLGIGNAGLVALAEKISINRSLRQLILECKGSDLDI